MNFVPDGPIQKLERNNAVLVERIIKLEDTIAKQTNDLEEGRKRLAEMEKDLSEMKKFFTDTVRSRNMIIRSYSKTGLVSKFIPERSEPLD